MNRKAIIISLAGITLFACITAFTGIIESESASPANVERALRDFASDPSLKHSSWGFYAINTTNGKVIASHNPDLALIPASAQKVVTTASALFMMGTDYRFATTISSAGPISRQGVLQGNLIIKGTGDPTLGSTTLHDSLSLDNLFRNWLAAIKQAGITRVEGSVIADGRYFDDHMIPPKYMWEDMGNYYGAGAHALTVNENMYTVYFEPARRVGDPAKVVITEPEIPGLVMRNDVTTGGPRTGDRVYIYGSPYSNERWLTGTVPHGESNFGVRGSIPDPGLFLASALTRFLSENNISVSGPAKTHRDAPDESFFRSGSILAIHTSPPMEAIAARTNFNSVNTYGENLIKALGKHGLDQGTFVAGSSVITGFWAQTGIDTRGMRLHDGSGLSPFNNITVKQLTEILLFASRDSAIFESLLKGLPMANRSGTLSNMFSGKVSAGVLVAKSGFLSNVRSYTGYTRCRNGNLIAFTIIVNNYEGTPLQMRDKMEVLMDALTRSRL